MDVTHRDILAVINEALIELKAKDFLALKQVSNKTIHNAGIFQDSDSISIAVILYSLSKLADRNPEPAYIHKTIALLESCRHLLEISDLTGFRDELHSLFKLISSFDKQLKLYLQEVLKKARISKGTKLYDHGISIAKAAEILDISQWDLMSYVGETQISDHFIGKVRVGKRLKDLKEFFKNEKIALTINSKKEKIPQSIDKKKLFFDSGPLISLTTNGLEGILEELHKDFDGDLYITPAVYSEVVERPLRSKKFRFDAIKLKKLVERGVLKIYTHPRLREFADSLIELANGVFFIKDQNMNIIHYAEMEVLAAASMERNHFVVVDERTTRELIETPKRLQEILHRKFHSPVIEDQDTLKKFKSTVGRIKIVRSIELATLAYEKGYLNKYLSESITGVKLLESVLWGIKLHGCSVSEMEIMKIINDEKKTR